MSLRIGDEAMFSVYKRRTACSVLVLTLASCDAEPQGRGTSIVLPGPKGDETQDGAAGEDADAPVFILPVESEGSVRLGSGQCAAVDIELADDAERLEISVDSPPALAGATLAVDANGYSAHWRWCPGAFGEPPAVGAYDIVLLADDGTHLPSARPYTIVVKEAEAEPDPKPEDDPDSCDEGWPTIEHLPATVDAADDATITALFVDDQGIVGFPLVEVSFEGGEETPGETAVYAMELSDGDRKAGVWVLKVAMEADVLHYRYRVSDGVPGGPCEHVLEDPVEGYLSVARP